MLKYRVKSCSIQCILYRKFNRFNQVANNSIELYALSFVNIIPKKCNLEKISLFFNYWLFDGKKNASFGLREKKPVNEFVVSTYLKFPKSAGKILPL